MKRPIIPAANAGWPSPMLRRAICYLVCLAMALFAARSQAVPSFARQTQRPCTACHVGGFGPQLTPFGRQFKLLGYTIKAGNGPNMPLSMMLVESYTHTAKAQANPPADGFSRNNNTELEQASVFVAGRISDHMGILAQATYSQNGGLFGWDNTDLRYARSFTAGSHNGIWGLTMNNNPTVTDVFNSTPAWSYPYMSADLAPGAPAVPLIVDGLGGQTIGLTGYTQIDGSWYLEAGGYRSLSPAFLDKVNAGFDGHIAGVAPYLRAAYTWNLNSGNVEVGGFFLNTRRGLAGTNAAGNYIALPGPSDRYRDVGADVSYERFYKAGNTLTVNALYVDERQTLDATYPMGGSSHLHDRLHAFNVNASYWLDNTWGATLGAFAYDGSADAGLYGDTRRPNTNGGILELDYNPFGKASSWGQPYLNLRIGAQYKFFNTFAGAAHNYNGSGRSASDNNTLFLYVWLAM